MALCLPSQTPFPDFSSFLIHAPSAPFLSAFFVFSSSLPTPLSFPISYFVFLSLSQVPMHTRTLYPCYFCFSSTVVLSTEATFLFLFPIFLQKTKICVSPHHPALHPESTLILAPFFLHPFLSCFYLGFLWFSLLEYLFLDTPARCLF